MAGSRILEKVSWKGLALRFRSKYAALVSPPVPTADITNRSSHSFPHHRLCAQFPGSRTAKTSYSAHPLELSSSSELEPNCNLQDTEAQRKHFPQAHTAQVAKGCLFQAFGFVLGEKSSVARTSLGKTHVLLNCLPLHPGFLGNRSLKLRAGMKPTSSKQPNRKWPQLEREKEGPFPIYSYRPPPKDVGPLG